MDEEGDRIVSVFESVFEAPDAAVRQRRVGIVEGVDVTVARQRKERSDKGIPQLTQRDFFCASMDRRTVRRTVRQPSKTVG